MNEKLLSYKNKIIDFWKARTTLQKGIMIGSIVSLIALLVVVTMFASKPNLVPLYSNLSPQETGQIKATLDAQGIHSEITDGGTTIKVPEAMAESLMVDLAAQGIPASDDVFFSSFGQGSFGMTENEFGMRKIAAIQNEIARLIKSFEWVDNAQVVISMPEQGIFINDTVEEAQASIVIDQKPGFKFNENQIQALYHLISKSVPNLPTDNIVIMNQMFEHFDYKNPDEFGNIASSYLTQQQIKEEVQKEIQQKVQQMLGIMMGRDKVLVTVTADLDFTQENRIEDLVEPVDDENMEGITISAERITEAYTGNGQDVGGIPDTGETDTPASYQEVEGANGEFEKIEERINSEVNRIKKEIVESPYKIRDLGIQVIVDPTTGTTTNDEGVVEPVYLSEEQQQQLTENINQMLSTVIRTSISENPDTLNINDKISVTMQQFNGMPTTDFEEPFLPTWVYIAAGALLIVIILLIVLLVRRRKKEEVEVFEEEASTVDVPDVNDEQETESSARRKQLEKMAKEKPDEFAKLLRTWLAED